MLSALLLSSMLLATPQAPAPPVVVPMPGTLKVVKRSFQAFGESFELEIDKGLVVLRNEVGDMLLCVFAERTPGTGMAAVSLGTTGFCSPEFGPDPFAERMAAAQEIFFFGGHMYTAKRFRDGFGEAMALYNEGGYLILSVDRPIRMFKGSRK